eukprot:2505596-Pyramimonas_sp.AAC.1
MVNVIDQLRLRLKLFQQFFVIITPSCVPSVRSVGEGTHPYDVYDYFVYCGGLSGVMASATYTGRSHPTAGRALIQ